MATNEIHLNDIGKQFVVQLYDNNGNPLNVSGATALQLWFKSPTGLTYSKTATFLTDGVDGQIQYVTVAGDMNEVGLWQMQAYAVVGTSTWHSNIYQFKVYPNLQ